MFDAGTSVILFLLASPGFYYPQLGTFMPPFLEGCVHALLFALFQAPSYSVAWGKLSRTAELWEYTLWLLPVLALATQVDWDLT